MSRQRKAKDQAPSAFFPDGKVDQAPPPGTVSREQAARDAALAQRPPLDAALLARGAERYRIYCAPCHGLAGDGHGLVVARGFPAPPAFTEERLRQAPDRHVLEVIANGYGQMYGYAARVQPADRWAIVAHIRALQLSQHAPVAELPAAQRDALREVAP
nr:cytochrome c [Pseudomonas sp. RIT-PI-AD]